MADTEKGKIVCRIKTCKTKILFKNYKKHLIDLHPGEDIKDLSGYGQEKISTSFFKRPRPPEPEEPPKEILPQHKKLKLTPFEDNENDLKKI